MDYSKIRFTMKKDDEYILTGLFDAVNAPFLYRKGTLIAVLVKVEMGKDIMEEVVLAVE